tara:strand:+ start:3028 stop:3669 length:642 start_codon:yes stop_codon:yes gene_type:complete
MTLYSADIKALAERVPKKDAPPNSPEPAAVKEKKPKTEKQIAAAERAAEKRRLKKEQKAADDKIVKDHEANVAKLSDLEEELRVLEERKAAKALKKTNKRKAVDEASVTTEDIVDEAIAEVEAEPVVKKAKKPKVAKVIKPADAEQPPAWVESIIRAVRGEQQKVSGEKKGQKKMRQEAKEEATEKWQDPQTRERISSVRDQAFEKIYKQIFH